MGLYSLRKRRRRGDFVTVFSYVIGGHTEDRQPNPSQTLTVFTGPLYFDNEDTA